MPSQFSNLNFANSWDLANWRERCAEQRKIAKTWPAFDAKMATCEEYHFSIGPWQIVFYLEIWNAPEHWHGGASIHEHVGYETMRIDHGLYKGARMEVPQDAFLATSSWVPEHFEQARFILAETFGPILRPGDKHQPAHEFRGGFTLQWRVPYEGPRPWRKAQH